MCLVTLAPGVSGARRCDGACVGAGAKCQGEGGTRGRRPVSGQTPIRDEDTAAATKDRGGLLGRVFGENRKLKRCFLPDLSE